MTSATSALIEIHYMEMGDKKNENNLEEIIGVLLGLIFRWF